MPAQQVRTSPAFQHSCHMVVARNPVYGRTLTSDACTTLCQFFWTVETPIHAMTPKGMSDLRIALRPVRENSCFIFVAGLSFSGLKARASGANTRPPWATPAPSAITHEAANTGAIHRRIAILVQNNSGPPAMTDSRVDMSSMVCNSPRHCRGASFVCQAITAMAALQASALDSSRLRATCPCSRAFFRFCGVAFSVLFASAIVLVRQVQQLFRVRNRLPEILCKHGGPITDGR